MNRSIAPYCISAFVVCQTAEGPRYLLIRRCGKYLPGTWQMVTGGIEEGETAAQAALREIQEETGLAPLRLYCADAVETFYMPANDKVNFVPVFIAFVEQMQVVHLSPTEHDAYEWLPFEEARAKLAWAEQKRIIALVHTSCVLKKPDDLLFVDPRPSVKRKETFSRTGVYAVALREEKLLVVQQTKGPHRGKFDFPGGGIEPGEAIEAALQRELREEVGMAFDSLEWLENITAVAEARDEKGNLYVFHQIGLIYRVDGVVPLQGDEAEMQPLWIPLQLLGEMPLSPLLKHMLPRIEELLLKKKEILRSGRGATCCEATPS